MQFHQRIHADYRRSVQYNMNEIAYKSLLAGSKCMPVLIGFKTVQMCLWTIQKFNSKI